MTSPEPASTVQATDEQGRRYRAGVFDPIDEAGLEDAPDDARFPARGTGPAFKRAERVPRVPKVRHLVGPSIIAAGMGLGAGEFLLWPNLITVNGYGIWWLFWIGVLSQFLVMGEIERWTIATGESVFGGMARLDRFSFWPWFFLVATLFSFFWPGWASLSGEFVGEIVFLITGVQLAWQPLAILMLAFIWVGLAASKIVYNALERFEIALVLGFFPLLLTTLLIVGLLPSDFLDLLKGAVSVGSAPPELLTGDQFPTLLLAVAYAGTGGTLLLAQSLWIRDKGFGMAIHQGRIAGIRGQNEDISETGFVFDSEDETALARFTGWMRSAHKELLVTFVVLSLVSVVITSMLVTSTLGVGNLDLAGDQSTMVSRQGQIIQEAGGVWLRVAFLLGGSFILFSTQIGIVDTVTRISGSIFYERYGRKTAFWTLKRTFLLFLTVLTIAAMGIIAASWLGGEALAALQPTFLLLVAGPFTISSMYAYTLVVGYMNTSRLPEALASPTWKRWGMLWAATLWGWFTTEVVARAVMGAVGIDASTVESLSWHPIRVACYALWVGSLVWFAIRVVPRRGRSA
ncbi:MAG: Nramp family divalent metal transporter [Gemmatimonadota bacterium]|nr:Nramp family divalent metal transporter [Gemmatimonadota bacterium]